MNLKKLSVLLILLNVITVAIAWSLLDSQSEKYNMETAELESKIENNKINHKEELSVSSAANANEGALKTIQIPIYTKQGNSLKIFTTIKDRSELIVIKSNSEWAQVISTRGFPVWVRGDLVESINKGYVTIITSAANARTTPSVSNSVLLGKLQRGEVLKVNRKQGEWVRVWSPIKFKALVKLSDLS